MCPSEDHEHAHHYVPNLERMSWRYERKRKRDSRSSRIDDEEDPGQATRTRPPTRLHVTPVSCRASWSCQGSSRAIGALALGKGVCRAARKTCQGCLRTRRRTSVFDPIFPSGLLLSGSLWHTTYSGYYRSRPPWEGAHIALNMAAPPPGTSYHFRFRNPSRRLPLFDLEDFRQHCFDVFPRASLSRYGLPDAL